MQAYSISLFLTTSLGWLRINLRYTVTYVT